jgi:hypothetical protein
MGSERDKRVAKLLRVARRLKTERDRAIRERDELAGRVWVGLSLVALREEAAAQLLESVGPSSTSERP